MLIEFINFYLIFVLVVSVLTSLVLLKFKLASRKVFLIMMLAIIILPAPVGYIYITYFTSIKEVVVPRLTGQRLASAKDALAELGLRAKEQGTVHSMKYEAGQVAQQQPEAGRIVKIGRTVRLITSSGKSQIFVPNLLGRQVAQAASLLDAEGLLFGEVKYEAARGAEIGVIISQDPLPQEEVAVGTVVNLVVATPEAEVVEPVQRENKDKPKNENNKDKEGGFWFW